MKRTERKHLKENELAIFAQNTQRVLEARRTQLTYGVAALLIVLAGLIGYFAWNGTVQGRAGSLLAEALAIDEARVGPPAAPGSPSPGLTFPTEREKHQTALTKFKVVADQYPSTSAGLFARYRQGTTYMALGEPKSAV